MNNFAKRVLAFMLMVCMLAAMVPAVVSAEAETESGAIVYDFELDQNPNLIWEPDDENDYNFGQTRLPHGSEYHQTALDDYYAKGIINWSFPHAVDEVGKVVSELSFGSAVENPIEWGGSYYKGGSTADKNWTGLRIATYSSGADIGWNALLLKAPDVGTYNVTLEYTNYAASSASTSIYLLPYTDAMQEKVENNVAEWNAEVTAIVGQGAEGEGYRGNFSSWIAAGSEPVPGQIMDLKQIDVDINVDEYLMIIAAPKGKSCYFQNVTFTPAEEEVIPAEVVERNYSISGTVTANTTLNKTGYTEAVETKYDNGEIDWSYAGTTSDGTTVLDSKKVYNKTMYSNVAGTENDVIAYEAYKLRSPGSGMYDISFETYVQYNAAGKSRTQVGTNVYIMEYAGDKEDGTLSIDPATVLTNGTYIGDHVVATRDDATANIYQVDYVGEYEFTEGKDYIIVLQMDVELWNSTYMTGHNVMSGFVIEPQEEIIDFVPKAYIGTTPYPTVAAAAAAAKTGETIKLEVDFVGNIEPANTGVSIDLNGHTWTVTTAETFANNEAIIDSVGTGALVTKNLDLFATAGNNNSLPLATGEYSYNLANYTMTADSASDIETSPDNAEATRFWFKLSLADSAAYDLIAAGDTGLSIGVKLAYGNNEKVYLFDDGEGTEAFAADWATAAKDTAKNIWLYVDVVGVDTLTSNLNVTPVLDVKGQEIPLSSVELTWTYEG